MELADRTNLTKYLLMSLQFLDMSIYDLIRLSLISNSTTDQTVNHLSLPINSMTYEASIDWLLNSNEVILAKILRFIIMNDFDCRRVNFYRELIHKYRLISHHLMIIFSHTDELVANLFIEKFINIFHDRFGFKLMVETSSNAICGYEHVFDGISEFLIVYSEKFKETKSDFGRQLWKYIENRDTDFQKRVGFNEFPLFIIGSEKIKMDQDYVVRGLKFQIDFNNYYEENYVHICERLYLNLSMRWGFKSINPPKIRNNMKIFVTFDKEDSKTAREQIVKVLNELNIECIPLNERNKSFISVFRNQISYCDAYIIFYHKVNDDWIDYHLVKLYKLGGKDKKHFICGLQPPEKFDDSLIGSKTDSRIVQNFNHTVPREAIIKFLEEVGQ